MISHLQLDTTTGGNKQRSSLLADAIFNSSSPSIDGPFSPSSILTPGFEAIFLSSPVSPTAQMNSKHKRTHSGGSIQSDVLNSPISPMTPIHATLMPAHHRSSSGGSIHTSLDSSSSDDPWGIEDMLREDIPLFVSPLLTAAQPRQIMEPSMMQTKIVPLPIMLQTRGMTVAKTEINLSAGTTALNLNMLQASRIPVAKPATNVSIRTPPALNLDMFPIFEMKTWSPNSLSASPHPPPSYPLPKSPKPATPSQFNRRGSLGVGSSQDFNTLLNSFSVYGPTDTPNILPVTTARRQQRSGSITSISSGGSSRRGSATIYKCEKPFCTKIYRNSNGLRYHYEHGNCEMDRTAFNSQDVAESQSADVRITSKPYFCRVEGCEDKRYKNLNGLKYHGSVRHPAMALTAIKGVLSSGFAPY